MEKIKTRIQNNRKVLMSFGEIVIKPKKTRRNVREISPILMQLSYGHTTQILAIEMDYLRRSAGISRTNNEFKCILDTEET